MNGLEFPYEGVVVMGLSTFIIWVTMSVLFLFGLTACTGLQKSGVQDSRVGYLSRQLKKSKVEVEQLKSENFALRTKIKKKRVSSRKVLAQSGDNFKSRTQSVKSLKKVSEMSEKDIYKTIIASYQSRKGRALEYYTNALIDRYPKSIYGDNALYLHGKYLYALAKYARALKSLDRALSLFPKGNKRASILLAKSMVYRKLELSDQARLILKEIMDMYPGTVEANRAQLELTSDRSVPREKM